MKKYEFTGETKVVFGRTLKQIRALVKINLDIFTEVNPGDLGGWIEKEENLTHDGNAWVYGDACVYGDADINCREHILTVGPIGSRNDITTFFRTKENLIKVKCGCFTGTLTEFIDKVEQTHRDNKYAKVYRLAAELAKQQIEL